MKRGCSENLKICIRSEFQETEIKAFHEIVRCAVNRQPLAASVDQIFLSQLECPLCTWSDNKVRELIAVKVLHTSLLNTTVVAFKVLTLGSCAPVPSPSPPFKTILELVLWNGLQSCRCITPDVINVIKMPSYQYFLYLREQKKVIGAYPSKLALTYL